MKACVSGHYECTQALVDAQADLELTNRVGQNAMMMACESPPSYFTQSQRQGRAKCALALLEATARIHEAGFPDRAASLKFAVERLQQIEVVLASTHVIEDAAVPLKARVLTLTADAQGVFVDLTRDVLIQRQNASDLKLDELAIAGDSSTCALHAPIEATHSYERSDV
jgi:hypothetical protein